jgi:general secretion pathway protein F
MPRFSYSAVDSRGTRHSGELESPTRVAAVEHLQRQGLIATGIGECGERSGRSLWQQIIALRRAPKPRSAGRDLVIITESLAALMKAGLPIDRALQVGANLARSAPTRAAMESLGRLVRSGRTVADAFDEVGIALPSYFVGMIRAGEIGGQLPESLARIAKLMSDQRAIRDRIKSALIYPALLAFVVIATVVVLLTVVLPRFQTMFAESESALPWITRFVLGLGGFLAAYWWPLLGIGAAATAAIIFYVGTPRGRTRLHTWLIRSRLLLGIPRAIECARFLRTLSTLMSSGVHIADAFRIAQATLSNVRLREAAEVARVRIKAGEGPSAALTSVGVFPPELLQFARVGEETGKLEEFLDHAATLLEAEAAALLERLLSLLVPLLTIGMGLIIAVLIGSVLVGLLSVNDLAF